MISEVVMPQMGADMKEGILLRWLKAPGDPVERGEAIAEIETDKANVEIEAFEAGVFRKAIVAEGTTVPVGDVIAVIGAAEDDVSKYESLDAATAAASAPVASPEGRTVGSSTATAAPAPAPPTQMVPPQAQAEGRLRVSPVARQVAAQQGVDLATVAGSGPDGRILRRDVERAAGAPAPVSPPGEDIVTAVELNRLRRATAQRMAESKREAPHYYLSMEIEMTEALAFREKANSSLADAGRISVNDLVLLATVKTLQKHPRFNSWWLDDGLQLHSHINLGIAVALDDGLLAPALLDCAAKGLTQISRDARDLAERARKGLPLRPEEYSGGTFTVTNLGGFGVDGLIGIINPPQTAILGIGAARDRAVVRAGEIVARPMMTAILAADHRATDGAEGARFLQTLQQYLEAPALILL